MHHALRWARNRIVGFILPHRMQTQFRIIDSTLAGWRVLELTLTLAKVKEISFLLLHLY